MRREFYVVKMDSSQCPSSSVGRWGLGVHEFTRTYNGTRPSYCSKCGCAFPLTPSSATATQPSVTPGLGAT